MTGGAPGDGLLRLGLALFCEAVEPVGMEDEPVIGPFLGAVLRPCEFLLRT